VIEIRTNAAVVARAFRALPALSSAALSTAVAREGAALQTRIRANASGRPGPNAQSGDYRRSISRQMTRGPGTITVEVGTNSPQGRRLEFGFWGMTDSLGRLFHQPAYPHFGPAVDGIEETFPAAITAALAAVIDHDRTEGPGR
jgi:hypothetical protein